MNTVQLCLRPSHVFPFTLKAIDIHSVFRLEATPLTVAKQQVAEKHQLWKSVFKMEEVTGLAYLLILIVLYCFITALKRRFQFKQGFLGLCLLWTMTLARMLTVGLGLRGNGDVNMSRNTVSVCSEKYQDARKSALFV